MSQLIDQCRIAVAGVIQASDLPVGTQIDSEKIVRAVLGTVCDVFNKAGNSCLDLAADELQAELDEVDA